MITETAPAKINLYLHVGPVRDDGLHDLASLFVFTEDGDVVSAEAADDLSLTIEGPFAAALDGFDVNDNLVMAAARALRDHAGLTQGAALRLEKNLPVAAGIGGGSADAAAALRALMRLWNVQLADEDLYRLAFRLGADVPACLSGAPVFVEGAGEILRRAPALPELYITLINPGVDMPTGPVFKAFDTDHPSPPAPAHPDIQLKSTQDVAAYMTASRNDLEAAAHSVEPKLIREVVSFLQEQPGALGARMSGSGATCFALFADERDANAAAEAARKMSWWAMASRLASG